MATYAAAGQRPAAITYWWTFRQRTEAEPVNSNDQLSIAVIGSLTVIVRGPALPHNGSSGQITGQVVPGYATLLYNLKPTHQSDRAASGAGGQAN